jgi:general secretion pathway protein L
MAETLIIRLASTADDPIHWLIIDQTNTTVIASGELSQATELSQLTDKAQGREVITLAPAIDIALKALTVPGKSSRAIRLAAPYMIEDELADDLEQLFFAFSTQKNDTAGHNCFLAVIKHAVIQQWLQQLSEANISVTQCLPDVLCLPLADKGWSLLQVGEHWLIRQGEHQGVVIETSLLALYLQQYRVNNPQNEKIQLQCFSPLSIELPQGYQLIEQSPELPLFLLAQQIKQCPVNLLQQQYEVKTTRSSMAKYWLIAAVLALVAVGVNVTEKVVQYRQLLAQQQQLEQEIIGLYKKAFPQTKRVRINTIRSQLKQQLKQSGPLGNQQDFLTVLSQLQPIFAQYPSLKPQSMKYDGKRQELRLQATATDYQTFEQFKIAVERANFDVKQGALTNDNGKVSGSLSIKVSA